MRFYVPEWDDNVDANYDFIHDEHSTLSTDTRKLHYIWDIFDYETTPIDGVLISREQVEGSQRKLENLTEYGVYHPKSVLHLPDWLPTISDCGAWGYKSLPFPPYSNRAMLDFYETMDVTVGVTVDHLVLGSGHKGRLYLDERAFDGSPLTPSDVPEDLTTEVNVMIDEWPTEWPAYVTEYDPSIVHDAPIAPFTEADFAGQPADVLAKLDDDPRAVCQNDDTQFRYELTLKNAEEMKALYDDGDYSFRLMVAVQGWDATSYANATRAVLDHGYQYIGIGGVAGSPVDDVRATVTAVGNVVKDYERSHSTRVDTHVFGFAKTDAFDSVGRSGMTSFDSASRLRSAWMGGDNYHLDSTRQYDAIRVRFGTARDTLDESIEKALRGQELLHALRAFDANTSIAKAIQDWYTTAAAALDGLLPYLDAHHLDEAYDQRLLRDIEAHFRDDYAYGRALRVNFSRPFRRRLIKLLRDADAETSLTKYGSLVETARHIFEDGFPQTLDQIRSLEDQQGEVATLSQIEYIVEDYVTADVIDDAEYLDEYKELLRTAPWRDCDCPICTELGIEVAVFRANNRNRRRGFHNMRRFYDEFEEELPKLLVATPTTGALADAESIEEFLTTAYPEFWTATHDLPVIELGAISSEGVREWWADAPTSLAQAPPGLADTLTDVGTRYQALYLYDLDAQISQEILAELEDVECSVHIHDSSEELRRAVLDRLGYDDDFCPTQLAQQELLEF